MDFLPAWLNPFDVLIAFAMIAGVALGFVRGLLRMVFSVLVLYVATIVAMSFYVPVGGFIRRMIPAFSETASETIAFMLLLILVAVILHFLLNRTYKDTEWPGVRQIDQLGGMVFGFVATTLWIGLVLTGIDFILGTPSPGGEAARSTLKAYFYNSNLVPIYFRFLPVAFATLKPWVPRGRLPDIFRVQPF